MLIKILVGFLAVIGGLVVLAITALFVGYFVFSYMMRRRIRKLLGEFDRDSFEIDENEDDAEWELGDIEIPPLNIHLVPTQDPDWSGNAELVDRTMRLLNRTGFTWIGDFDDEEDFGLYRLMWGDQGKLIALIHYRAELAEPYLEIIGEKTNGGYIRVHNFPSPPLAESAISTTQHFVQSISEQRLARRMITFARKLAESHPTVKIAKENAAKTYEKAYAEEMLWRIRRGGLSNDEIAAVFEAEGLELDEDMLKKVRNRWQYAIESHLIEYSRKASEQDDEGNEVLAVYDGSSQGFLLDRIDGFLEAISDKMTDVKEMDVSKMRDDLKGLLKKFTPREAIARFRALLPQSLRYSLIDQVKQPVETDFYLIPESE